MQIKKRKKNKKENQRRDFSLFKNIYFRKLVILGWVRWLTPVNPSTLGGQSRQIMRSRDGDHPGQHGKTPSLLKIQKLAGRGGARL